MRIVFSSLKYYFVFIFLLKYFFTITVILSFQLLGNNENINIINNIIVVKKVQILLAIFIQLVVWYSSQN